MNREWREFLRSLILPSILTAAWWVTGIEEMLFWVRLAWGLTVWGWMKDSIAARVVEKLKEAKDA